MPLDPTDEATACTDPGTSSVVFQMADRELNRQVRVTVQPGALLKLDGGANPLSAFELHRAKFEQIASDKFDTTSGITDLVVREEDVTV